MERLASLDALVVRQKREIGEALTGFETRNQYTVMDTGGRQLYTAFEESGMLSRQFLRAMRPFTINVVGPGQEPVLHVRRPFRFYFQEVEVYDAQNRSLGRIIRRFSIVRRLYSVLDSAGREIYELYGPILHPWTFEIRQHEREFGKITKKWSGLLSESLTDADNFGVTFPFDWTPDLKGLFLGAVFLIDFVHFEENQSR